MKATFYAIIKPTWSRGYPPDKVKVSSLRVDRITHEVPRKISKDEMVCKLNIDVDPKVFEPLRPVVDIVIPVDAIEARVHVTAEPPHLLPVIDPAERGNSDLTSHG